MTRLLPLLLGFLCAACASAPQRPNVVLIISDGAPELYDVVDDPFENKNLAEQDPKRVRRLQGLIQAWWKVD